MRERRLPVEPGLGRLLGQLVKNYPALGPHALLIVNDIDQPHATVPANRRALEADRTLVEQLDQGIRVKTSTASRGPTVTYGPGATFPTGRRVRRKPGDDPRQSPLELDDGPTQERD